MPCLGCPVGSLDVNGWGSVGGLEPQYIPDVEVGETTHLLNH